MKPKRRRGLFEEFSCTRRLDAVRASPVRQLPGFSLKEPPMFGEGRFRGEGKLSGTVLDQHHESEAGSFRGFSPSGMPWTRSNNHTGTDADGNSAFR